MGNEEREDTSAENEREDPEAERKRKDQHLAEENRARQIRQGVISEESEEESESE